MVIQLIDNIAKIIENAIDLILPHRCVVSGEIVDAPGMVAPGVWAGLRFIGEPWCEVCGMPFEFSTEKGALCASCLREHPVFDRARAALVYDEASRGMILKFKHGDHLHHVKTFAPFMQRAGIDILEPGKILVPVPLHRWRLLRRRYNQAALLAQEIGRLCNLSCVPSALIRRRSTKSQGHLDFRARHRNVKGAFIVSPTARAHLEGKKVVLIDDVHTSGATIRECTKALRAIGVSSVDVLTLARVVRPEFYD